MTITQAFIAGLCLGFLIGTVAVEFWLHRGEGK